MKRMSIVWLLVWTLVLQALPVYADGGSQSVQDESAIMMESGQSIQQDAEASTNEGEQSNQEADAITIEGEQYSAVNQTPVAKPERDALRGSSTELSGNDFLFFKSAAGAPIPEDGYVAEYEVNAPVPGTYGLVIVASPIAAGHVSPYGIKINDGEYADVNSTLATKVGELQSPTNLFHRYKLNPITLVEGANTISFQVTDGRSMDGRVYFFLDKLELIKLPWGLTGISGNAPNNLFEEGDEIQLTVGFTDSASSGHTVAYSVYDYDGNTVAQDELLLQDNVPSYTVTLPQLGRGHYTFVAGEDGNGSTVSEYFSIVMDSAGRRTGIANPFAIDVAGGSLFPGADAPDYARAVRLTGVDYVRERMHWNSISSAQDTYDFSKYDPYNDAYADEGIRVLQLNHIAPPWAKDAGKNLPRSLMDAYNLAKTSAQHYGAGSDWEFWNEPDIQYTTDSETADQYAAFLKATTIAARDAGTGTQVALGGIAYPPGGYVELLVQNEIADYIDIYNYHGHRNDNESTKLMAMPPTFATNTEFIQDYGLGGKPVYVTEAGISLKFHDGTQVLTAEQLRTQARYLATSTIESVATGVDKHFWFVFPNYLENGMSWGSFSSRATPYAAINAQAAMTHALGEAVYLGRLGGLPAGVESYVFRDGMDSVAALWSENNVPVTIPGSAAATGDALLTDIMGREQALALSAGGYALVSGPDVQYVRITGSFPGLTEPFFDEAEPFAPALTSVDRIVLVQNYPEATAAKAKAKGYLLDKTATTTVEVDVYNFNDEPMTGIVTGTTYGGWSFATPAADVTVAPYAKETVTFELAGSPSVAADVKFPVAFQGTFGGEETSRSITLIASDENLPATPSLLVPGINDPDNWESNISSGSTSQVTSPAQGEAQFDYAFGSGDKWSYPNFTLDGATHFAGTEGLTFEVYFPEPIEGVTLRSFVYESNGAGYFTSGGVAPTGGWQSVKMPWSDFAAFGDPDDNFHLDPEQIREFSIGVNSRTAMQVGYTIRNVGVYTQPDSGLYGKIVDLAPAHNAEVVAGNIAITAELVQGEIPVEAHTIQVLVDGAQVPHQMNGQTIQAAATLQPGNHALTVKGFDANGRLAAAKASVTVVAAGGGSGDGNGGGTIIVEEPSGVMKATAADLKPAASGEGLKLQLAANADQVALGAELFGAMSGQELRIEAGDVRLTIPAATLKPLLEGKDKDGKLYSRIVIGIEELAEYAEGQLAGMADLEGRLTAAGKPFELTMYAVDSGGSRFAPEAFEAPVAVTFQYEEGQTEPELLGVYYWDPAAGEPRYIRSVLDREQGTIEARLEHFSTYSLMAYDKSYADVPRHHWLYPALRQLSAAHVVTGVSEEHFAPDRQVTRAEFVTLWMRTLGTAEPAGEQENDDAAFVDVPATAYYAEAVAAARQAGIVNGRGDGRFAPDELITREEMAAMLVRGLVQAGQPAGADAGQPFSFADRDDVSAWALPALEQAASIGLVGGYEDGTLRPQRWASRAEAAGMIWRAYRL